jgi:preprotein translocase subunit SecF
VPFELVPPDTHIDFIGKRRLFAAISVAMLLASVAAFFVRGVKLGIDFAGGTEVQVRFADAARAEGGAIRSLVGACGIQEAAVVPFGDAPGEFLIKFGAPSPEVFEGALAASGCPLFDRDRDQLREAARTAEGSDATGLVVDALARALTNEVGSVEVQRFEFVGPRVGEELRRDGLSAILIACGLVLVYVAVRFSTRFAPGAVVALVHDIAITAGIFVMLGLEFDLRVLAALLAILGYSLNDTIIVYDRIRENMELRTKVDLADVLNRSVNQTLSRTILTSGTTLLAVLALLVLGGETLFPFALAMVLGIVVGTYSSVFIASPILLWLESRYGGIASAAGGRERPPADAGGKGKRAKASGA